MQQRPLTVGTSSRPLAAAVQERLAAEVLRKLRLAAEAERKEDRDIICSEVFADVTGELNSASRETTGHLYTRWYEALAPYFCKTWDASEALLAACRRLWGQPFTAPTFALLLHQWLLVHGEAGGRDQRQKHLAVLVSGARQLFIGDVEMASLAFQPLYVFLAEQVVLSSDRSRLAALPLPGRESVMSVVATFMPHYSSKEDCLAALAQFPSPRSPMQQGGGGGSLSGAALGVDGADGADFVVECIADALAKEIRTEAGLLRYLSALAALSASPALGGLHTATRLRLQHVLYTLTQPGGPSNPSRAVNRQAAAVLDALFPSGRRARRLISMIFLLVHPHDWLWLPVWHVLAHGTRRALARFLSAYIWLLALCARVFGRRAVD